MVGGLRGTARFRLAVSSDCSRESIKASCKTREKQGAQVQQGWILSAEVAAKFSVGYSWRGWRSASYCVMNKQGKIGIGEEERGAGDAATLFILGGRLSWRTQMLVLFQTCCSRVALGCHERRQHRAEID